MISYFRKPITNLKPKNSLSAADICKLIKNNWYKETEVYRKIEEKNERANYKANNFDYVTFSGEFEKRGLQNIRNYNGLMTIDIDGLENIEEIRNKIKDDKYIHILFTSPSGAGLKLVFFTDNKTVGSHTAYFLSIQDYFKEKYDIEIDKSGKDPARACFLCYDPDVIFNKRPEIWKKHKKEEKKSRVIKDYDALDYKDMEQYNFVDKGSYYITNCPNCDRDAFFYKDGFMLKCNHKDSCGFQENMLKSKIDSLIKKFKANTGNSVLKKEIYNLMSKLGNFDREDYIKQFKEIFNSGIRTARGDYDQAMSRGDRAEANYTHEEFTFRNPDDWEMSEGGIIHNGTKRITYEPYYINAVGKDVNSKIEYVEMKYGKGMKKTRRIERQKISKTNDIIEESKYGCPVDSGNALDLIKFFRSWYAINRADFPTFEVVTQLGWQKDRFILPERVISDNGSTTNVNYIGNIRTGAYRERGSLKEWVRVIKKFGDLKDGHIIRFLIYAGFTAVLVEKLGIRPFVIHLHGDTSKGKTTALKIIASIFGKPAESYTMTRWKSTQTFIIRYLEQLKNLPLIIDELSSERNGNNIDAILYQFESGVSKGKASKGNANSFEEQRTFATGIFSSGEPPIISDQAYTGAEVRTWQFTGQPFGESNAVLVAEVEKMIEENYGVAFEYFLKSYFANSNLYEELNNKDDNFLDNKNFNDIENRIMKQIKPIYITGTLVNELFKFEWDVDADMKEIFKQLTNNLKSEGSKDRTVDKLLAEINGMYQQNIKGFYEVQPDMNGKQVANITKSGGKVSGFVFGRDMGWIKKDFIEKFNLEAKSGTKGRYVLNMLLDGKVISKGRVQKRVNGSYVDLIYFKDFLLDESGEEEEVF